MYVKPLMQSPVDEMSFNTRDNEYHYNLSFFSLENRIIIILQLNVLLD